jgi:hypothetical protein
MRPHVWDALKYESGTYMQHLKTFILSEGNRYQTLQLASQDIHPQKAPDSPARGLDGWSFMMRTPDKKFALLYFENQAVLPTLSGFAANESYHLQWFKPRNGEWTAGGTIRSDDQGLLTLPSFPDQQNPSTTDWAAKLLKP